MDRILSWVDAEPVLTRVGPVVLAVVAYLVARGLIDQDTADLFVALAGAVVGGGAVVGTRAAVTPTVKLPGNGE